MTQFAQLPNRGFLRFTGPDAASFLQGLFTIDVVKQALGDVRYGLLLTPQGKFLHDFFLMRTEEGFLLETDASRLPDLHARLTRYRLRAKVEMGVEEGKVYAVWDGEPEVALSFIDPRLSALGYRVWGAKPPGEAGDYEAHRISLGIPQAGTELIPDQTLPLEMRLDALHAIDFDKGCYTGQEVTARTRFRAQLRKQLYAVEAEQALPTAPCAITCAGKEVGQLRSSHGMHGLALLQSEHAGEVLQAEEMSIHARVLTWME